MANIDVNNLHKLNQPAQLGIAALVVALIMGLGYFVLFKDQLSEIDTLSEKEEQLKTDYSSKAKQAANLPVLQQELEQIRTAFNVLLKQLPTDAEIPNLIQELHQAGAKNGMRMDSVKPLPPEAEDTSLPQEGRLAAERRRAAAAAQQKATAANQPAAVNNDTSTEPQSLIQKLPYAISVTGSYNQIAQFTRDIGRLSRIVTLDKITLKPASDKDGENGKLTLSANANTYKALEVAPASSASQPAAAQ